MFHHQFHHQWPTFTLNFETDKSDEHPADLPPQGPYPEYPRTVFFWINQVDESSRKERSQARAKPTISSLDLANKYGAPKVWITAHLNQQIQEANSCTSLPFTLLMVAAYTVMVILHDPAVHVYSVEESISFDIADNANFAWTSDWVGHKGFEDVNTHADFWSFMTLGFVPLLFVQDQQLSEERDPEDPDVAPTFYVLPTEDRGTLLNYNRVIGGMRILQERASPGPCASYGTNQAFYGGVCQHGLGYELFPETWTAFSTNDPVDEFWLWTEEPQTTLLDILYQKEAEGWLSKATRKIEIAIPVLNLEYSIYSIIYVNFFWSRGGRIWKRIIPMSTYSSWWHGPQNIVVDVIWATCMGWITVTEGLNIRKTYKVSGWHGVRHDYLNFWIIVDWVSVIIAVVLTIIFVLRLNESSNLNGLASKIAATDNVVYQDLYRSSCKDFLVALEKEVHQTYQFRIFLGVYPFVIIMRLFKAFAAQPRLSMVTRTLSGAAVDLLHFLLVFCSIFLTYAVAGIILFGREADGFATLPRAVVSCFRFMMGDFEWEEISVVGRIEAGLWFVSFMVITTMLMLNMLLAMVMDSYTDQKAKIGNADTLLDEARQAYRRWRGQRTREQLSLRDIQKALHEYSVKMEFERQQAADDHPRRIASLFSRSTNRTPKHSNKDKKRRPDVAPEEDHAAFGMASSTRDFSNARSSANTIGETHPDNLMTVDKLMVICAGLRRRQATKLIMTALSNYYEDNKEEVKMEDMLKSVLRVDWYTKKMREKVESDREQISRDIGLDKKKSGQLPHGDIGDVSLSVKKFKTDVSGGGVSDEDEGDNSKNLSELSDLRGVSEPSFMEVLDTCRLELRAAQEWIGQDLQDLSNRAREDNEPFRNLDEVPELGLVQVLDNEADVLEACRFSGIGTENDDMRRKVLGRVGRCIRKDHTDRTAKCDIFGFGLIWFSVRALCRAPLPPGPQRVLDNMHVIENKSKEFSSGKNTRSTMTLRSTTTLKSSVTLKPGLIAAPAAGTEGSTTVTAYGSSQVTTDPAWLVRELEREQKVARATLREASHAVQELQERESQELKEKDEVAKRFKQLKKKVVFLSQQHMQLQEQVRLREDRRGSVANATKDEYMDLVHTMIDENQRLKARLQRGARSAAGSHPPSIVAARDDDQDDAERRMHILFELQDDEDDVSSSFTSSHLSSLSSSRVRRPRRNQRHVPRH